MKQTRHSRRILAAVLAAMLMVAMSLTAFATGEDGPGPSEDTLRGSITITNPQPGVTYNAYRIFDVTYATVDSTTSYSYTIEGSSPWFETVNKYAKNEGLEEGKDNYLILTKAAGGDTYVVSTKPGFSAANFAKALQGAVSGKTAQATGTLAEDAAEDATLSLGSELPLGYYLIMGTNAGLCSLDTTDPDAEVTDKNDMPFDKELTGVDDDPIAPTDSEGVTVGSVLTYTIKGEVPDTTGFEQYVYIAEDTMDVGLTMNTDVSLKIGGTRNEETGVIAGGTDFSLGSDTSDTSGTAPAPADMDVNKVYYKAATATSGGGFKLRLNMMDYADHAGDSVWITYTATVNDKAVNQISKNNAELKYGNDPDHLTDGNPSVVQVFTSNIVIDKYDEKNNNKLAGAKFVLKRGTGADAEYYKGNITITKKEDGSIEKAELDEDGLTWVASPDAEDGTSNVPVTTEESPDGITVVETDSAGAAIFPGLGNGTYYLVEVEAPAGYNLLDEPQEVTVAATLTDAGVLENDTVTVAVPNSAGSLLPSTGGIGTTIFYVLGSVLLVLAAAWFVISRRRAQTEEK